MFEYRQARAAKKSAMLVVSFALVFTVGCHRDPNVRKHKYLESGNNTRKKASIKRPQSSSRMRSRWIHITRTRISNLPRPI